jgi:hypothetical protein
MAVVAPILWKPERQHNTTSMPNAQIKRVLTMLSFLQHMNCMAVTPRPGRKRDTTSSMGNKQDQKDCWICSHFARYTIKLITDIEARSLTN